MVGKRYAMICFQTLGIVSTSFHVIPKKCESRREDKLAVLQPLRFDSCLHDKREGDFSPKNNMRRVFR